MSARRAVPHGGVFEGLRSAGPSPEQALRAPRLTEELRVAQSLEPGLDDFRKLQPSQVVGRLQLAKQELAEQRAQVAAALFVGTAQACLKGSYWAPSFGAPGAEEVDCRHFVRPISCVHPATKMPSASSLQARNEGLTITCLQGCNELDAALQLASSRECRHVAIIRCTGMDDPREVRRYSNIFEDQLFLRTTYFQAFERMAEDLHESPQEVLKQGGLIYTSGVGILRGAVAEGAPWVHRPPQVDVIWLTLPARPMLAEQELYGLQEQRDLVASALDRAFAWAAAHGADAVVMPPLGCGTHGCKHPRLQMAGLIHEVAQMHAKHLPAVCVASDHPLHCEASWWDDFAAGVREGRPVPP
ncbi:unnamed protein product, partial [Polarella glacialis]